MAIETYFVHGNAIVPEQTGAGDTFSPGPLTDVAGAHWTNIIGLAQGWGRTYRGKSGQGVWFHAPIPTPVQRLGNRVRLQDVFVMLKTDSGCLLSSLHVWDGADNVQRIDGLHTGGDFWHNTVPGVNAFSPREAGGALHQMNFGLELSIRINFTSESNVAFASAGANFVVPL